MKIVLPTDTSHTIKIIPRYLTALVLSMYLKNEATEVENLTTHTVLETDNYVLLSFDAQFEEGDKYQIRILDSVGEVYFRGKIMATTQNIQGFDQSKNYYTYE